jgi:hypothetical protein
MAFGRKNKALAELGQATRFAGAVYFQLYKIVQSLPQLIFSAIFQVDIMPFLFREFKDVHC